MLETNTFGAGDKTFRAGDEQFGAGGECIENECSNFIHIHTATCSYQQLPNKTHVELTFKNGHYPAVEIKTVFRCTMTSLVTLN